MKGRIVYSSGRSTPWERRHIFSIRDIMLKVTISDDHCNEPVWTTSDGGHVQLSYPGNPDLCELGLNSLFGSYVCQNTPERSEYQ